MRTLICLRTTKSGCWREEARLTNVEGARTSAGMRIRRTLERQGEMRDRRFVSQMERGWRARSTDRLEARPTLARPEVE